MIISRSLLLRMRNVLDKSCRENQNPHFMFDTFFSEYHAVYEVMWKHTVEQERSHMTIQRMWIAGWTHSECGMHTAFPQQQCLSKHTSMLCLYVQYIACLVIHV